MNILALSSLVVAFLLLSIGHVVLVRNPKARLNQVFFLFCLVGAYIGFTEYSFRIAASISAAQFWLKVAFLWNFALPLELHFVLRVWLWTPLSLRSSRRGSVASWNSVALRGKNREQAR